MYNEINCEVIRDLLPPYAYGLANPATCALVDGHLETCESCNQALEQLRNEEEAMPLPPGEALGRVKKKIKRKKLRNALVSVIAAIAVLCAGFYFLVVRDYAVPYSEGDFQVQFVNEDWEPDENGTPALSYYRANHYLSSHGEFYHTYSDGSKLVVYFVRLMKYPKLQVKLNGSNGLMNGAADGEWQGSLLLNGAVTEPLVTPDGENVWLNQSPFDTDYSLAEKPPKTTCKVYYLEDFGKLKPKRRSTRVVNRISTEEPSEEDLLPYALTEEVLKYCTLIWEGDVTPE